MKAWLFPYLFIYVALTQVYLGALALLCFRTMVPARWLAPLVPQATRLLRLGGPLTVLFIPLALAAPELYPWARHDPGLNEFRRAYLSLTGFWVRGIIYWATWHLLARSALRERPWAGTFGFVLLFLSGTFASVDWLQSLEDGFTSTIFGLIFLLSSFMLAFGIACLAAPECPPDARQDQGNVHLALICTWAYIAFIQFLVVWSGNLPHEVAWYHLRLQHGWALFPALLGAGQFFLPFFLLLTKAVKRSSRAMRSLAALTVFCQCAFLYWQTQPELQEYFRFTVPDVLAIALLFAVLALLCRRADAPSAA